MSPTKELVDSQMLFNLLLRRDFDCYKYIHSFGQEHVLKILESALKTNTTSTDRRPATIRLSHEAKLYNNEMYKKIREIALSNQIIPGLTQDSSIACYATMNLTPLHSVPGQYGGSLITVQVNPDFKNIHGCFWLQGICAQDRCNKKSYSDNLGSWEDPQGDINWIRFLPKQLRTFFGFSFDENCNTFTFPDIQEANGAIEKFNSISAPLNTYIPLKLEEANGQIKNDKQYLSYFAEGKLPIASPEFGQSWFYHDYLYHFIGMLQTPTEVLELMIHLSDHILKSENKKCFFICSSILDHATTWGFRIRGLNYINKKPDYDFYFYQDVKRPSYLQEIIHEFAYLSNEIQLSNISEENTKETIDRIFSKMNQSGFFDYVRNIHDKSDLKNIVEETLTPNIREHCQKMVKVITQTELPK